MKNGNGRTKRLIAGGLVGLLGLTFAPSTAGAAIDTTAFCANVPTGQSGFTDIAQAGVHQRNIECLKEAGVITGQTATTYNPTGTLSRAQMATIIANMIDFADAQDAPGGATVPSLPTAAAAQDKFTDDEGSVHENNINRLAQAGVVNGTTATTFSPSGIVSRAQMASFIAQAIAFIQGAALPEGSDAFTDDETSVHEANINRLATADIVDGTGASSSKATFTPNGDLSRAQASFANQALAFLHKNGVINPIPPRAGVGATSRPELIQATIVSTVTEGANRGTTVAFKWDEAGTPPGGNAAAPFFRVFNNDGLFETGDFASQSSDFQTTNVRFEDVDTAAEAQALTLATVDPGALRDLSGEENPEGDAPLNNVGTQALPAGITNAPDIVSVGNFRQANADNTFVDVTFDEAANDVTGGGDSLLLIYTQGAPSAQAECSYDSGEGDTVLTYICNDASDDGDLETTILQAAPIIARGVLEAGSVEDTSSDTVPNPLQAAEIANSGNTGAPDLVSVTFNLNATSGGNPADSALVTFDQNIALTGAPATFWMAYGLPGNDDIDTPTTVTAVGASSPTQVVLFFDDGDLVGKTGLSIEEGVVTASDGANIGFPNQEDEVGVGNSTAAATAGNTSLPELLSVSKSATLDLGGNPTGGTTYSYAFDEDVDDATVADTLFFGYSANGTRFVADNCAADTAEATDNIVRCSAYDVAAAGGTQASNTQLGTFVLGTVQDGAVTEEVGGNPSEAEGAAVVSG